MLDIWNAAAFRFTLVALRLGVFDVLSQGPRSASALAQEIGCDQIYAYADVARWLAAAGFKNVRRINLLQAPGQSIVVGTVP